MTKKTASNSANVNEIAAHDSSEMGAKIANKDILDNAKYKSISRFAANTSPAYLYGVARLFNLPVKQKIRYLEIGCGSGQNLAVIANSMPNSEFVGVDISKDAILEANKQIDNLNLKNLKFYSKSFTDITTNELGKFDIIVMQGVFSWLKDDLRNDIISAAKQCLNENGLFYVSYNVSPGWHMAAPMIEYLKTILKNIPEGEQRQVQMATHLKFLYNAFLNKKTPYAMMMMREVENLSTQTYENIMHNYMDREPISFLDICNMANKHGLQYLSETTPAMLVVKNRVPKEIEDLKNLVEQQWYLDALTGTKFRASIFVHNNLNISRNITTESINESNLNFLCNFHPVGGKEVLSKENIVSNNEIKFMLNDGQEIFHNNPIVKACLVEIYNFKFKSNDFGTTVKNICKEFGFDEKSVSETLGFLIQTYIFSGVIIPIYGIQWDYKQASDKPMLNAFARKQIEQNEQNIVGLSYNTVKLDLISKTIFTNCDGKHSAKDLESLLLEEFKTGKISCNVENKETKVVRAMTYQEVQEMAPTWVKNYIEIANLNGLL